MQDFLKNNNEIFQIKNVLPTTYWKKNSNH